MTIEVLPLGTRCNLGCDYCYQENQRHNPNAVGSYDREGLQARLETITEPWVLFGGEPLLLPLRDVEALLEIGFRRTGRTHVQTNGSLITSRHIDVFERYRTHVGISIDGPGPLNDARWAGTLEATRKMTRRTCEAVEALCARARASGQAELVPSFIICLHRLNLSDEAWPVFKDWLRHLDGLGVSHAQHHFLDLDARAGELAVSNDLLIDRMLDLWRFQAELTRLRFKEFDDLIALQRGQAGQTCVWNFCDPWNTRSVEGVNGDSTPTQCGRAGSNDGIDWTPAEGFGTPSECRASNWVGNRSHERQMSLYVTPQEHGGCRGCAYWLMCQGHCPGSAVPSLKDAEGDWRLRSVYCDVFKAQFREAERRLLEADVLPLSRSPQRERMEHRLYELWASGREAYLDNLVGEARGTLPGYMDATRHSDHTDAVSRHGDAHSDSHGDAHGDAHGDHADVR
jgi:uncharacterized protein